MQPNSTTPQRFHFAKLKFYAHKTITPLSPFPQPRATILILSVSMNLTTLCTSYVQNHAILVLLWLVYFTSCSDLKVHPCCTYHVPECLPCVSSVSLVTQSCPTLCYPMDCKAEQYSTSHIYHILFILSSLSEYLDCFHPLTIVNNISIAFFNFILN